MAGMGIEIRGIVEDEYEPLARTLLAAFGEHPTTEVLEDERLPVEIDRMLAADDGGELVGSAGAFSFDLTVPGGGQVPVAGVTWVGVLPTHRRRGVLTAMMERQLDDVVERGEPIAVLTASEAGIYGRYGYGVATRLAKVSLDTTGGLALLAEPAVGGRMRLVVDGEQHSAVAAPVYDAVRRHRVGELSRPEPWWTKLQRDREDWRHGFSARFCVVHEADDGTVDGYCWYRVKEGWGDDDAVSRAVVRIWDMAAASDEVEAAFLHYLASLDLATSVMTWARPVDDPWAYRLADIRRHRVHVVHDHLYVRLLDVARALAARTYESSGVLTLAVDDPFRPSAGGTFRLEVDGSGEATCERVEEGGSADLHLDTSALGSLYLGDVAPSLLAASGRLRPGDEAALAAADRILPTSRKPFCTSEF
jgi:predicted acetyltransferase